MQRGGAKDILFRNLYWLLPVVAAGLVYLSMLGAQLVWDDAVVHTRQMPYVDSLRAAFFLPAETPGLSRLYYRPAVFLTYLADHRAASLLAQELPRVLHAANLLYHMVATGLVYLLAAHVLRGERRREAAAVAAFVFALHPIHVESVCMVAGRSDILSAVFLLASLLLALRFAERGGWGTAASSALLFAFALLSKENALAGVAVIPAFLWADSGSQEESAKGVRSVARPVVRPVVRLLPLYAGLTAALAGYFVLRSVAGSRLVSSGSEVSPTALSDFFSALGYYLIKSVWPWPHNHHVNVLPSPAVAAAALAAAACLGAAAWRLGRRRRLYAALAILCAAALAPSLATVPQRLLPTLVAERYLYLPSVAVALAAGLVFARLREKNKALAWGAAAIVLAACGAGSFIQSRAWVNEISFWESTAQNPDNASNGNVLVNLGEVYRLAGRYDEAIPVLLKGLGPDVVAKRPTQTTMRLNLSAAYSGRSMRKLEAGDPAGALADAKSAVAALPSAREGAQVDALYFNFHGLALLLKARAQQALTGHPDRESLRQACDSLSRSQQLDPRNPNIARNLAECQKSLAEAERR